MAQVYKSNAYNMHCSGVQLSIKIDHWLNILDNTTINYGWCKIDYWGQMTKSLVINKNIYMYSVKICFVFFYGLTTAASIEYPFSPMLYIYIIYIYIIYIYICHVPKHFVTHKKQVLYFVRIWYSVVHISQRKIYLSFIEWKFWLSVRSVQLFLMIN